MYTFSNKTYSLLSGQDSQAIQVCYCKVIRFKSVRWHDDGSSEHTLGYAPPSVCPEHPSNVYIHRYFSIHRYIGCLHVKEIQIFKKYGESDWAKK